MRYITMSILLVFLNGCSPKEVKPWEKANLAKDTMQFGGINSAVKKFEEHVYFSKEATRGGNGVSGGGCGCN